MTTGKRPSEQIVALFQALGDRTRLRLLNLLAEGELCVCYLVEVLGISQPKASRHLAYLRRAGVVASRRDGKWIHYRVTEPEDPAAASLLTETMKVLSHEPDMERDRSALLRAYCATEPPASLRKAPRPVLDADVH